MIFYVLPKWLEPLKPVACQAGKPWLPITGHLWLPSKCIYKHMKTSNPCYQNTGRVAECKHKAANVHTDTWMTFTLFRIKSRVFLNNEQQKNCYSKIIFTINCRFIWSERFFFIKKMVQLIIKSFNLYFVIGDRWTNHRSWVSLPCLSW